MNAGREMDAIVATKVMGWHGVEMRPLPRSLAPGLAAEQEENPDDYLRPCGFPPGRPMSMMQFAPYYSLDIAAAWQVVAQAGLRLPIFFELHGGGGIWVAMFDTTNHHGFPAEASTAPEAICLAALKALGVTASG